MKPAVFLDRDGTIIEDCGYISSPQQVSLRPGAADAIRRLSQSGRLVILISNQSGVARGLFDEAALSSVHARLEELLAAEGASLDGAYYCPFLDGSEAVVEKYRRDSELRKPKPGMILLAASELGIDLAQSWMIGDSAVDVEAGRSAGCRTILIQGNGKADPALPPPSRPLQGAGYLNTSEPSPSGGGISEHIRAVPFRGRVPLPGETVPPLPLGEGWGEGSTLTDPLPSWIVSGLLEAAEFVEHPMDPTSQTTQKNPKTALTKSATSLEPQKSSEGEVVNLLARIHGELAENRRHERQQDFSLLRLFAGLLQMFAIVAAVWGLLALLQEAYPPSTARFALAGFLQLASLSAFAIDRFR